MKNLPPEVFMITEEEIAEVEQLQIEGR